MEFYVIDGLEKMFEMVKKRVKEFGMDVKFKVVEVESFFIFDDFFDIVVFFFVFCIVLELERVIEEIK